MCKILQIFSSMIVTSSDGANGALKLHPFSFWKSLHDGGSALFLLNCLFQGIFFSSCKEHIMSFSMNSTISLSAFSSAFEISKHGLADVYP